MSSNNIALPKGTILQKNYRIMDVLGQGGFGITYLAYDEALKQKVAIKEYLPSSLASRDHTTHAVNLNSTENSAVFQWGLKRFLEEARILAKLSHPNIVSVFNFIPLNGTGYMIMKYEQGQVFKKWIEKYNNQHIPQEEILKILTPLLEALRVVHKAGLAHRDIKPDNIYIREDESPVLLDFGAARNIDSGQSHTLAAIVASGYSPNEQYGNVSEQGPWTDIYALGAVLYKTITGTTPPDAPSRIDASFSGTQDPCQKLSNLNIQGYDPEFLAAIDWALQLKSKDRPQSIAEWTASFGQKTLEATKIVPQNLSTSSSYKNAISTTSILNSTIHSQEDTIQIRPFQQPSREIKRKVSAAKWIILGLAFCCICAASLYGYWWSHKKNDLIGHELGSERNIGTLTTKKIIISDYIGGGDLGDLYRFDLSKDSVVNLKLKTHPSDIQIRIFNSQNKKLKLYKTDQGLISELKSGSYSLFIFSPSVIPTNYIINAHSHPEDLSIRPQNSLDKSIDIQRFGDLNKIPVRYNGQIFPTQKEHYFKLNLNKPAKISVKTNIINGIGRVTLSDEFGIALKSAKLNPDFAQTLTETIDKGVYHIILSTNERNIFNYGLEVKKELADETFKTKTVNESNTFLATKNPKGADYQSNATAALETGMSKDEALLAAKMLARLKLIAKVKNDTTLPKGKTTNLASISKFFHLFEVGIPSDESWNSQYTKKTVTTKLKAKIEKIENKNLINATLDKKIIKSSTPLKFNLSAVQDMYIGIFGWQADGTVLRLYPRKRGNNFILIEGEKIKLPLPGEVPFQSTPLPGRSSSAEAIFIVGCYERVDYSTIAPSLWEGEPLSISTSLFFQRIATSCKKDLSVKVLPYTVTAN